MGRTFHHWNPDLKFRRSELRKILIFRPFSSILSTTSHIKNFSVFLYLHLYLSLSICDSLCLPVRTGLSPGEKVLGRDFLYSPPNKWVQNRHDSSFGLRPGPFGHPRVLRSRCRDEDPPRYSDSSRKSPSGRPPTRVVHPPGGRPPGRWTYRPRQGSICLRYPIYLYLDSITPDGCRSHETFD